jgi:hypothetical protein
MSKQRPQQSRLDLPKEVKMTAEEQKLDKFKTTFKTVI